MFGAVVRRLEAIPNSGNREWMARELGITRQKPHAFLLRLNEQQLVERVSMSERLLKLGGGMACGQS